MKQPPSSIESERALLGACFIRPEILPQVRVLIRGEDFYLDRHSKIFQAMIALGKETEPASVFTWCKEHNADVLIQFILDLSDFVSTSAGWEYHAQIIKDKATRREIIASCAKASEQAFGQDGTPEILSALKEDVREISTIGGKPYRDNKELVNVVWKDIERRTTEGEHFVGLPTGFKNLDEKVFGLEPKTTTYLIARPSIGKTALALNIAENIPGRVPFFSLESTAEAITRRRMSAKSKVYLSRIRTASFEDGQYPYLLKAVNDLCESEMIILDKPIFKTLENLTAQCESMAMDGPINLIVIDHIQRMRSLKRLQNRHLELSWISEELSSLAKTLNTHILVLCQLNREIEKRPSKSKYPQMFDVRESGDLEANADNMIGLWRADKESEETRVEWLKGRDIGTFVTWLRFDRMIQKFYDAEPQSETLHETLHETWSDNEVA